MSVLSLRWIESRVRQELYRQDLTTSETSADGTAWPVPAPNGATVMFLEQGAPALAIELTRNKKNKRLTRWILVLLAILAAGGSARFGFNQQQAPGVTVCHRACVSIGVEPLEKEFGQSC